MVTDKPTNESGFTLVELLVVVFIIGLLASVVVMTLPARPSAGVKAASDLAGAFTRAGRESIASGDPIAWSVSKAGYKFERYRRGEWTPIGRPATLDGDGSSLALRVRYSAAEASRDDSAADDPEETQLDQVHLIFAPTGETTGAEIEIIDGALRHAVSVGEGGQVNLMIQGG